MNPRVTEIRERLIAIDLAEGRLRSERTVLLNELWERLKENEEGADWTTAYKGKPGEILSAIWNAPKHRIKAVDLCSKVWGDGAISDKTLWQTLWRAKIALKKKKSKFFIKSLKCPKTGEIKGYGLRKTHSTKTIS